MGIAQAQAEYFVACLPEHQFALSRTRKHVLDDPHMLLDAVRYRTEIGAEHHSVHTAHLNRGSHSNGAEPHAVDQDVGLEIVERRPLVRVRLARRRVLDPVVVEVPIEFEAATIDASPPPMWTISTCSFGWRSNTPEPIIRAPFTVESKGRPTASLRRYWMSASCPIDCIGGWMCTTMSFASANSHSHSALGLSRKMRSAPSP